MNNVKRKLEVGYLPTVLPHAKAITVVFNRDPEWNDKRSGPFRFKDSEGCVQEDVREDYRIERGHPLFEQRMKDIASMISRRIVDKVKRMNGHAIGVWPYRIDIDPKFDLNNIDDLVEFGEGSESQPKTPRP